METQDLSDRWLQARVRAVALATERWLEEYRFNEAAKGLYDFVWHEFCDWYLEMAKVRIQEGGPPALAARRGILFGLTNSLKLLHPLMPFITEEIWHHLPGTDGDLIAAEWPDARSMAEDEDAVEALDLLMETVVSIRNIRSEMNVPPAREAAVSIRADAHAGALYGEAAPYLRALARVSELHVGPDLEKPKHAAHDVVRHSEVFVHLEGLIDLDLERQRLGKELEKTEKLVLSARKKLENPDFLDRAKAEVVEKEREKLHLLEAALGKLSRAREALAD
jgi:valyl-tRNA synthetase